MMWALVAIILAVTAAMILGTRSPSRVRTDRVEEPESTEPPEGR